MNINAITVKQLNFYVKSLLEGDIPLQSIALTGEISNFKNHYASGHFYFTLKDSAASVRCVMFKSAARFVDFEPEDGCQVVLIGRVSLYEKDGQYQFYAERIFRAGTGEAAAELEKLKEKLKGKGFFDLSRKRTLPKFPRKIAVVTSKTGAAVKDILSILSRRWPVAEVILCPASVQGASAVKEMTDALDRIYALGTADIIIIGRGGGSAEDLTEFNSEELAEKIFVSPVPVISAVGHETDFSISDLVADLRAPTPSAAAELAVPDIKEIANKFYKYGNTLKSLLTGKYNYSAARFDKLLASAFLKRPEESIISARAEHADRLSDRAADAFSDIVDKCGSRLMQDAARLDALSPLKVLSRGYSLAFKDGTTVIKSSDCIEVGDEISLKFSNGGAKCRVTEKE